MNLNFIKGLILEDTVKMNPFLIQNLFYKYTKFVLAEVKIETYQDKITLSFLWLFHVVAGEFMRK